MVLLALYYGYQDLFFFSYSGGHLKPGKKGEVFAKNEGAEILNESDVGL